MRFLLLVLSALSLTACQKTNTVTTPAQSTNANVTPNAPNSFAKITAIINEATWSSAKTTTDTGMYLAARVANSDDIQIKGFGAFTSGTQLLDDAIYMSLQNVTDTGLVALSFNNYITYSTTDSMGTEYYSSQVANKGFVRITYVDNNKISGEFEFEGANTSGNSTIVVKQGRFTNIYLEK